MYLCGILDGQNQQLANEVRMYLDGDVDASTGNRPGVDPQSVPRIKGSKSIHGKSNKAANKFELKGKCKRDAVESTIGVQKAK
jgi:hypothetical protein